MSHKPDDRESASFCQVNNLENLLYLIQNKDSALRLLDNFPRGRAPKSPARGSLGDRTGSAIFSFGDSTGIAVPLAPSKVERSESAAADEPRGQSSAEQKGCQAKPDVFPRNLLKTNDRSTKQVSIFRDLLFCAPPSGNRIRHATFALALDRRREEVIPLCQFQSGETS